MKFKLTGKYIVLLLVNKEISGVQKLVILVIYGIIVWNAHA